MPSSSESVECIISVGSNIEREVRLPEAINPNKAGTIDLGKIDIDFIHRPG